MKLRRFDKVVCGYNLYDYESPHDRIPPGTKMTVLEVDENAYGTRMCLAVTEDQKMTWVAERSLAQVHHQAVVSRPIVPVGDSPDTDEPVYREPRVCPHCFR